MMKTPLLPLLCGVLSLAGCGYDRFGPWPGEAACDPVANTDIGYLRRHYYGSPALVREQIVVVGRVTSSDRAGNFYRTLLVEDPTGALEVMVGLNDLHNDYPPGLCVAVHLRGLALGAWAGVMQAGLEPQSWDYRTTGYLSHPAVVAQYVVRGTSVLPLRARSLTLAELDTSLCGRLVRIEGLRCDEPLPAPWAEGERNTFRRFRDGRGDSLMVCTSPYARFASDPMPEGRVALTGILMFGPAGGRDAFQIKLRDEEDVELL